MSTRFPVLLLLTALGISAGAFGGGRRQGPLVHRGMCDASAAVAVDGRRFIAAGDENNVLRVFRLDLPGEPLQTIPWDRFLGIDPTADDHPEVDIEGATVVQDRIYWISSHGRNRQGKWRRNRHRFFATTVAVAKEEVTLRPFGRAYDRLATDLIQDKRLKDLGLAEALGPPGRRVERLAPKKAGLNIEALAATPDGQSLLIGFRNPLVKGKALLVPLRNPAAVLRDAAAPELGDPILLKLEAAARGGIVRLGIRSIEYSAQHKAYLIAAGPPADERAFALFRWSGEAADEPTLLAAGTKRIGDLRAFTPEALMVYPHTRRVQLLSDDGSLPVKVRGPSECKKGTFRNGYCQAKHLKDAKRKTFRSVWVDVR